VCGRRRGPPPARHPGGMVLWATILILQGAGFVGKRKSNRKGYKIFYERIREKNRFFGIKSAKVDNENFIREEIKKF